MRNLMMYPCRLSYPSTWKIPITTIPKSSHSSNMAQMEQLQKDWQLKKNKN